jgi:hypothetical protein
VSAAAPRAAYDMDPFRRAAGTRAMTVTRVTARLMGRSLAIVEVTSLDHIPASGGVLADGPPLSGVLPRPAVFLIRGGADCCATAYGSVSRSARRSCCRQPPAPRGVP